MIFLVRHAKAGHRNDESPSDSQRPLTAAGWEQANKIVGPLIEAGAMGPLLSSPFVRCQQTLSVLAQRLGQDVQLDSRLREGKAFLPMLELMAQTADGSVLCSHGDMIPDVMTAIERRGCLITTTANWKKGSVWAIERSVDGEFITAGSWPPPG